MEEEDEAVTIEEVANEDFKGESCEEKVAGAKVSALQASQEKAKDLSYYYAHNAGKDSSFPPDAVIRKEDPLYRSDGLGPHKLSTDEHLPLGRSSDHVRWMETYSFADEGASVKIYVEFPESIKGANIQCEYSRFGVELLVHQPTPSVVYGVRIRERDGWVLEHERSGGFAHEIVPEKSRRCLSSASSQASVGDFAPGVHKIETQEGASPIDFRFHRTDGASASTRTSRRTRITLTVAKKDEKEKWYELKKKDIKANMPR